MFRSCRCVSAPLLRSGGTRRCCFPPPPQISTNTFPTNAILFHTPYLQHRLSHISSFKEDGYFRLAHLRDVCVGEDCYHVRGVRGGGPGGQGTNSSSSKVELRVCVAKLRDYFDETLIRQLCEQERGRSLNTAEDCIILASHEHRSAHLNREACLRRLKEMIQKASWVPPVEADPIKRASHIVTSHKAERRRKSSVRKMQRMVRKGQW